LNPDVRDKTRRLLDREPRASDEKAVVGDIYYFCSC